MSRFFTIIFFLINIVNCSFVYAGFDAGGGGRIAIGIGSRILYQSLNDEHDNDSVSVSLGIEEFADVVQVDGEKKQLIIDANKIKVSCSMEREKSVSSLYSDPVPHSDNMKSLEKFKVLAKDANMTVLFIDFKEAKKLDDGKILLTLKDDWGTSVNIYHLHKGGEITFEEYQGQLDLKNWSEFENDFSIDLFFDRHN